MFATNELKRLFQSQPSNPKESWNIAVVYREGAPQPWVVACGYEIENGQWSRGNYFIEKEDAMKNFINNVKIYCM